MLVLLHWKLDPVTFTGRLSHPIWKPVLYGYSTAAEHFSNIRIQPAEQPGHYQEKSFFLIWVLEGPAGEGPGPNTTTWLYPFLHAHCSFSDDNLRKERKSRLFRLSGTHKKMSEKGVLGCQKNALGWSQCQKNALLAKALMLLNSAFFLLDTLNLRRPCQNEEKNIKLLVFLEKMTIPSVLLFFSPDRQMDSFLDTFGGSWKMDRVGNEWKAQTFFFSYIILQTFHPL